MVEFFQSLQLRDNYHDYLRLYNLDHSFFITKSFILSLVFNSRHNINLLTYFFSGVLIKIAQTQPIFACIAKGATNGSCYMSNSVLQNQVQYLLCCVYLFVLCLSCLCSVKVVSPLFCQSQKLVLFLLCCLVLSIQKVQSPKLNSLSFIFTNPLSLCSK